MGQAKQTWFTVGGRVQHRKTGEKGRIQTFKGEAPQEQKCKIGWDNGSVSWVVSKSIRRIHWI